MTFSKSISTPVSTGSALKPEERGGVSPTQTSATSTKGGLSLRRLRNGARVYAQSKWGGSIGALVSVAACGLLFVVRILEGNERAALKISFGLFLVGWLFSYTKKD